MHDLVFLFFDEFLSSWSQISTTRGIFSLQKAVNSSDLLGYTMSQNRINLVRQNLAKQCFFENSTILAFLKKLYMKSRCRVGLSDLEEPIQLWNSLSE